MNLEQNKISSDQDGAATIEALLARHLKDRRGYGEEEERVRKSERPGLLVTY